ncbi:hypothetical protein PIB30_017060 [Stylosanthes scabra]|uniref:Uncharacterized protein n=1 Tax=Stylosanthes scabra TaxID=79078 RepID=A0ABU6S7S5_9FABA|nr:hypothetical protein [Stylosanthes scabra]
MKWSEIEASRFSCKVHPNNTQQPGVCASCLRDKLFKLNRNKPTNSSFPASPQSFSSATLAYGRRHLRYDSCVLDSVSSSISFNDGLKKSRSVAFTSREREVNGDNRSKENTLWSKLLKLTRKFKK